MNDNTSKQILKMPTYCLLKICYICCKTNNNKISIIKYHVR